MYHIITLSPSRDRLAGDLGVARRGAAEVVDDGGEAEDLLDRAWGSAPGRRAAARAARGARAARACRRTSCCGSCRCRRRRAGRRRRGSRRRRGARRRPRRRAAASRGCLPRLLDLARRSARAGRPPSRRASAAPRRARPSAAPPRSARSSRPGAGMSSSGRPISSASTPSGIGTAMSATKSQRSRRSITASITRRRSREPRSSSRRDRVGHEGALQDLAVLGVLGRILVEQQVAVDVQRGDLVGVQEDPGAVGAERLGSRLTWPRPRRGGSATRSRRWPVRFQRTGASARMRANRACGGPSANRRGPSSTSSRDHVRRCRNMDLEQVDLMNPSC